MKKISEEKQEGQQKFWSRIKLPETLGWVCFCGPHRWKRFSFTMDINDNLRGTSYMWQLVTSSYGPLRNPSEGPRLLVPHGIVLILMREWASSKNTDC